MKENTKVSIIIPVYNVEDYLDYCVETVLNQKHKNIEVILVDDGSTDNSSRMLDKYQQRDNRVRVIHKKNEGVSKARNTGMEAATGEYLCFADADDFVAPDYVTYLLELAEKYKTDISLSNEMATTFSCRNNNFPPHNNYTEEIIEGTEAAKRILYYNIPIGCYNKLFKTSFLKEHNIRFIDGLIVGEGFNFNTLCFQYATNIAIGNKKVYCYRRNNPISCMTSFNIYKAKVAMEAIELIKKNLRYNSTELQAACDFAYWHTAGDMYNWMVLAKVKCQHLEEYKYFFTHIKKGAKKALIAPINKKEKIRALLQLIHPHLFAYLLEFRRWKDNRRLKRNG